METSDLDGHIYLKLNTEYQQLITVVCQHLQEQWWRADELGFFEATGPGHLHLVNHVLFCIPNPSGMKCEEICPTAEDEIGSSNRITVQIVLSTAANRQQNG